MALILCITVLFRMSTQCTYCHTLIVIHVCQLLEATEWIRCLDIINFTNKVSRHPIWTSCYNYRDANSTVSAVLIQIWPSDLSKICTKYSFKHCLKSYKTVFSLSLIMRVQILAMVEYRLSPWNTDFALAEYKFGPFKVGLSATGWHLWM